MSVLRFGKHLIQCFKEYKYMSTALSKADEYTSTPQYPPILDISHEKVVERKKQAEYEQIKAIKTVEEKQIKLNMPKYYGFKCYMLLEDHIPYNNLALIQHVTRTHLIRDYKLPKFYDTIDVSGVLESVKKDVEEMLLVEVDKFRLVIVL